MLERIGGNIVERNIGNCLDASFVGIVHIALSQFIKVETKYHVRLQELKGINKWSIDIAFIFRLYITKNLF